MNDVTSSSRLRRKRLYTGVIGGALAVVIAGIAAWFLVETDSAGGRTGCDGLLADGLTERALGGAYRSDLSCRELGHAITKATVAGDGRAHTEAQAAAMKNVLLAVGNETGEHGTPHIDADLRKPLAEALADYTDVNVALGDPTDSAHVGGSLPASPPWKEKDGYHLSVPSETLVRVLRAVSDDPAAYATVRGAQTRWEAERLGGLPATAEPVRLGVGARALGKLDGIAADVRRGMSAGEAETWDATVSDRLASGAAPVPDAKTDLAGHVERAWRHGLAGASAAERGTAVEEQCARMLTSWADAVAADGHTADDGVNQCLSNATGNRTRVERMLR